jgi:hypothetical protein
MPATPFHLDERLDRTWPDGPDEPTDHRVGESLTNE